MLFTAIFLSLLITGWLICGFVPWLALSIATRGNAGLGNLPLCLFAALVAGLAVPLLGLTNSTGLWLSFLLAFLVPVLLLAARRFSMGAASAHRAASESVHKDARTE